MNGSPPAAVAEALRKRFGAEPAFVTPAHHRQRAGTAPVPLLARASCGAPSDPLPTLS